ncbi:hypothetical protein B0T17DRAFT_512555 [Bombardia bombarda]|uniref:Uncharacterized protein n=1 Tax=Bombardia bombarda TaxID=252184 RepID=A0AA39U2N5_9PEZI|nr:hypothetical protein B0T17DRAFT_512555 [Bombardia bombarda]
MFANVWQSGRDAEFSTIYGRMWLRSGKTSDIVKSVLYLSLNIKEHEPGSSMLTESTNKRLNRERRSSLAFTTRGKFHKPAAAERETRKQQEVNEKGKGASVKDGSDRIELFVYTRESNNMTDWFAQLVRSLATKQTKSKALNLATLFELLGFIVHRQSTTASVRQVGEVDMRVYE